MQRIEENSRTAYLQTKMEYRQATPLSTGILKRLTTNDSIARFCMQGIEVFTLEEHSTSTYLQSNKELSSGHTLEYRYFEKTV